MTNGAKRHTRRERQSCMGLLRAGVTLPAVLLIARTASAAAGSDLPSPGFLSDTPPPRYPPVAIVVGGHSGMLFGTATTRELSDVVRGESASPLTGVHFGPRYRVLPALSLGARGAVSFVRASRWWQGELDARVHPFGARRPDLWVGIDGGFVAVAEALEADELGPATTLTRSGALLGAGVGIDFKVVRYLALGPELRGLIFPFGPADRLPPRGTSYGTQIGASVGVTLTVLFGD